MKRILTILLIVLLVCACQSGPRHTRYGMYYWRTSLSWSASEQVWADSVGVETLYLRLFDVVKDGKEATIGMRPEATLRFDDEHIAKGLATRFRSIVPVVFLSPGLLGRDNAGKAAALADMLLKRIDQMTGRNGLGTCKEIQIDYDWTRSDMHVYFTLLQQLADSLHARGRTLSTTIRLHQLAMQAPPVDRGVLMCYNTGRIQDPDEPNSILSKESVAPYLRHLKDYCLPLALALPQFGWNLVFHQRQFCFIAPGLCLSDTAQFQRIDDTHYRALVYQSVPGAASATTNSSQRIYPGDIIRREESSDSLNALILEQMCRQRPELADEIIYYRN